MMRLYEFLLGKISPSRLDPMGLGKLAWDYWRGLMRNPGDVLAQNITLATDQLKLLGYATRRAVSRSPEAVIEPEKGDRRFGDQAWSERLVFDLFKQAYLLTARHLIALAALGKLGPRDQRKLNFITRQMVDAFAPTNFALTNPEVLRATIDSKGENLVSGMKNLAHDLVAGKGRLRISMVDESAFEVGRNLATTPGKIIYENELMQLIQYAPSTDKVYQIPLIIYPPWINKFYILDLSPKNSFIRWAVSQGYTVFVVSWANPDASLAGKSFEDYLNQGVFEALDAIEAATGERRVNAIGYCIGGTLLACALSQMAVTGDDRIRSATFFTAQVDFSEAGDLTVFTDEYQLEQLERTMKKRGYLDASEMAQTFNLLRANDLIWSFVVNNYLLGRPPAAFDLLYWNGDSTRMPVTMHTFYLRNMYLENRLARPGGITLNGIPVDLGKIKTPVFLQSSRDDHIAPYPSVYKATQLYAGPVTFMLAGSGHIAGVINPPSANKYFYYTNDKLPAAVEDWIETADYHEGSWWPYWHQWLYRRSGRKVSARTPGSGGLAAIEDAPGRYVTMK